MRYIKALSIFLPVVLFSLNNAIGQAGGKGMLRISADSACLIIFDGDSLGTFSINEVRQVATDPGEHIIVAVFKEEKTVKKTAIVSRSGTTVVRLTSPQNVPKDVVEKIDTNNLTAEKATALFRNELQRQSPVDIRKLKFLLTKGADILATDNHGWSLLHEAAYQGDTALILQCLKGGVPVNGKSIGQYDFSTPLSNAITRKQTSAIDVLLRHNATYGIPDGQGEMVYDSGGRYVGQFKNGKREGTGTFYYPSGNIYTGNWVRDLENGKGKYTWKDGTTYEGDYVDGDRNGEGVLVFGAYTRQKGRKYTGHFVDNKFSGRGTLYFEGGGIYKGDFWDNKRNGAGTMLYADSGGRYIGNWRDDMREGEGTLFTSNGSKYVGNWFNNKKSGFGVLYHAEKKFYEGEWQDNEINGQGTLYTKGGTKITGTFVNGLPHGKSVVEFEDGDRYEGNMGSKGMTGDGILYLVSGDIYEGHFEESKKNGYGTLSIGKNNPKDIKNCPKCKVYKGYWEGNLKNGVGKCYDISGNLIFEGNFTDDVPDEKYPR